MSKSLIKNIVNHYKSRFKDNPVLVKSPGRINLIGEHTDYNEGYVLPAAIDKSIVAAIGKSGNNVCLIFALDNNESYEFKLKNIQPVENGGWRNYVIGVVAEIQKKGLKLEPFNVVFGGDIPQGAGLSSSAALENSIVFGLNELFDLNMTKFEMIHVSQKAEHNYAGVKCGIMDQYATMFGIKNSALFLDCKTLEATPINIDFKDYQLVLINTNVKHILVDAAYNERREACEKVARLLNLNSLREANESDLISIKDIIPESDYQKALYVIQENVRVLKAIKCMEDKNINALGNLLFETHHGLQHQFRVSCKELDFLVDEAKLNSVVLGARMVGGGFGGCTINIVKTDDVKAFTKYISNAYKHKFGADCSVYFVELSQGTHLLANSFNC
ncbi:MAG: galactokinase [Bacteroidetes bacterium]|nr:MAG: galactokinase [Bacteroidota bacterium]